MFYAKKYSRKVILLFLILFSCISFGCDDEYYLNKDTDQYTSMSILENKYELLVKKKEELENKIQALESDVDFYETRVEEIRNEINQVKEDVEKMYGVFNTLENKIMKGSVMVVHSAYENNGWWFIDDYDWIGGGQGSGFIIKEDSNYYYILTNHHVVTIEQSTDKNSYKVYDYRRKSYDATLLFASDYYDMAVLRIKKSKTLNVNPLAKQNAEVDEVVYSLAYPGGQRNSISAGKVKGYQYINITDKGKSNYEVLVYDAFAIGGSSGSMVINENYEVVGIHTWSSNSINTNKDDYDSNGSPVEKIREFLNKNGFSI